jgi:hypothetical protein
MDILISAVPPATASVQYQREQLARSVSFEIRPHPELMFGCNFRKLDAVSGQLKHLRVDSVLGSVDITQAILDCIGEIDELLLDYTVSRPP